jgi:CHASE2 domain-containing sensor protein
MKEKKEPRAKLERKNILNLAFWTGAWVITMAISTFGSLYLWESNALLSLLAILLNFAVGIGMILANIRHLNSLDELQRKIQLEAMGIALGLAVVGGLAYSSLDQTNIIGYNAEISHLVILIGISLQN